MHPHKGGSRRYEGISQIHADQPVTNRWRGSETSPGHRIQDSVVPYLVTDDRASISEPRAHHIDTKNSKNSGRRSEIKNFHSLFKIFSLGAARLQQEATFSFVSFCSLIINNNSNDKTLSIYLYLSRYVLVHIT